MTVVLLLSVKNYLFIFLNWIKVSFDNLAFYFAEALLGKMDVVIQSVSKGYIQKGNKKNTSL